MEPSLNEPDWRFSEKWHKEISELGFVMIPTALLAYYPALNLTPTEFLILVNIESYRWDAKKLPYPTVETLAKRTNLTPRTVSRTITSLEKDKQLIEREKRNRTSNRYCIDRLIYKLLEIIRNDSNGELGGLKKLKKADSPNPQYLTPMSSKEYAANKTKRRKRHPSRLGF